MLLAIHVLSGHRCLGMDPHFGSGQIFLSPDAAVAKPAADVEARRNLQQKIRIWFRLGSGSAFGSWSFCSATYRSPAKSRLIFSLGSLLWKSFAHSTQCMGA